MDISNFIQLFTNGEKNINDEERMLSTVTGGLLLGQALIGNRNPLKMAAGGYLLYRGISGHCAAYSALDRIKNAEPKDISIKTSLTVNKPVDEVYATWRDLENLPNFMSHLESVTVTGKTTSSWKARIPGGLGTIDWEATIIKDEPNEQIQWQSNEGAMIENAGAVSFRDAGDLGTEIQIYLSYHAPAGKIGEGIARLLNPVFEHMILQDVSNFTEYIEAERVHAMAGLPAY